MTVKNKPKKTSGSHYKPFVGLHRSRALFTHYVEEAENGSLECAALVFKYLFHPQKPAITYKIDVDATSLETQADSILNAMYSGIIDIDSAHKMLDAIAKKVAIIESSELIARVENIEKNLQRSA